VRERQAGDRSTAPFILYDLEGELFFGAAPELDRCFDDIIKRSETEPLRHVILRVKRVRNPDVVCLERLEHFLRHAERHGFRVLLAGVRPDLLDAFSRLHFSAWFPIDQVFAQGMDEDSATLAAIRAVYRRIADERGEVTPGPSFNHPDALEYLI
jgi:SulP family sulfate permease